MKKNLLFSPRLHRGAGPRDIDSRRLRVSVCRMQTPSEEHGPELGKYASIFSSEEAYQNWFNEDLRHAEALIEVMRREMQKKIGSMTPEQRAEVEALHRQFCDEIADATIPEHYNPLVDRFLELIAQPSLSDEEEAEVKAMAPKLSRLIDLALGLAEPYRTEAIATLTATQGQVKQLLMYLDKQ